MTVPNSELQLRIQRIESGLEQVGSLLVPVEISDGIRKAITLCNIDPEMALGRARKVLDFILADVYKREFGHPAGTQPLENLIQQLAKAGKLPRTMVAYANSVRELGNAGVHGYSERVGEDDVVSSLENLMRLLAWYCELVRPTADEKNAFVVTPAEEIKPPLKPEQDTGSMPASPPVEIVPPPASQKPVEQVPSPAELEPVPPAAPEPTPDPVEEAEDAPTIGASPQEILADSYYRKGRGEPLQGGTAVPYFDSAIREYTDLLAKADQVWSADAMYKFTGLDKPLKLSKQQWMDELRYKLGDAYIMRATSKVYAQNYGAAAAKPDLDYAIPLLEQIEAAKANPDMMLLDVGFLINVRGSLLQAYFFRTNCPNELAGQLHDVNEYVRRWEMVYGKTGIEELVDDLQLSWLCIMLQRRSYIKSQLKDYPGAVADAERVVSTWEAARQARPTDANIASGLQKARHYLSAMKTNATLGKFTGWFKR